MGIKKEQLYMDGKRLLKQASDNYEDPQSNQYPQHTLHDMAFPEDKDKNTEGQVIPSNDDETPPRILEYYGEDKQFITKPKNTPPRQEVFDGFVDEEGADDCEPYSCPPYIVYFTNDQEQESQILCPDGSNDSGHGAMVTKATTICKPTVYPSLSQLDHDRGSVEVPLADVGDPHKVISPGRRYCVYVAFSILLFALIILALLVGIKVMGGESFPSSDSHSPTSGPTSDEDISLFPTLFPTSEIDYWYFQKFFQALGYEEWKFTVNSPQSRALKWIMEEDELQLSCMDNGLKQRFILALFYFITTSNGQSPWLSCNPDFKDSSNAICDLEVYTMKRKNRFAYVPNSSFRWLSREHECNWAGNVCDNWNIIRSMDLTGQNITGTLPTELAALPFIQSISLAYNKFTGTLPVEYATSAMARNLIKLELHDNQINGSIPTEYSLFRELQFLNIGNNNLAGSIPSELGRLTNLVSLRLAQNNLRGTIPSELYSLSKLKYLSLFSNSLSGSIDARIGNFNAITSISLADNQFTGEIPSNLAILSSLEVLHLQGNQFNGSVPREICEFKVENGGALQVLTADCLPVGNAPNQCRCCTICCNRQSENCAT